MDRPVGVERRTIATELRVDEQKRIEGYAAVFDAWSELLFGGFREIIHPGTFSRTLQTADVRALFNHDPNYVMGRNRAGTLQLAEDSRGLHFRVQPPETQWASDLQMSVRRGDINQGSFQFDAVVDEWHNGQEFRERHLYDVNLYDVSLVTFPAYPQAQVSVRSLAAEFLGRARADAAEPDVIRALVEQLRGMLPAEEPRVEEPTVGLVMRRRWLRLEELAG